jgi:hypothetical protein
MRAMKHSTLVVAGIAVLCATSVSFAITNSVGTGISWSFEAPYTNGQGVASVLGTDGWYGDPSSLVVSNLGAEMSAPSAGFPLSGATHFNIAVLSDTVTNMVMGGAGTTIWLDHLIQPHLWGDGEAPSSNSIPADAQMAYYVNSSNQVVLYHRGMVDLSDTGNMWSVIESPEVPSNSWVRMSIGMDYADKEGAYKYFQVMIDGQFAASTNAIKAPLSDYSGGGTYFAMASGSPALPAQMNSISLSGTGKFDDFAIVTNKPSIAIIHTIVATVMAGTNGGTITPEGDVMVDDGTNQTFVIATVDSFWTIEKVIIDNNGTTTTNSAPLASPYTNTLTAVAASGSIDAYFTAVTTNGISGISVPLWWLDDAGLAGADPDADPDSDGLTTAQEHLASTHPNDGMSNFRITRTWQENGTNYVQWESQLIDPSLPDFVVESAAAMSNTFTEAGTMPRSSTNTWMETAPAAETFYRLEATDTP